MLQIGPNSLGPDLSYSWAQAASDLGQIAPIVALTGFFLLAIITDLVLPRSRRGDVVAMFAVVGFAYSLGIGLAGLSTLEALARAAAPVRGGAQPPLVCATIEAGRGEVYAALFRWVGGEPVRETADLSYRPEDLLRALPTGARVVGDGSAALERAVRETGREIEVIDPWPMLAATLALWGSRTLLPGSPYVRGGARPNYVRPSDAEVVKR